MRVDRDPLHTGKGLEGPSVRQQLSLKIQKYVIDLVGTSFRSVVPADLLLF